MFPRGLGREMIRADTRGSYTYDFMQGQSKSMSLPFPRRIAKRFLIKLTNLIASSPLGASGLCVCFRAVEHAIWTERPRQDCRAVCALV
ncbi:hypothetical protein VTN31DRAFT_4280 [Thermomyces dupontii]|uniref:uncharacterized protein n=1 Tax=Talaromyces thermophilus TaxID=28565 RepID=UPI0037432D8C